MMGKKKLTATRADVRDAFLRAGIDPKAWFEQEIRKTEQQPPDGSSVLETLQMLRDVLFRETKKRPKARTRRASTR
jgi:hypothetical protein